MCKTNVIIAQVRKLEVLEAELHREKESGSDDGSTLSIDRISSGTELSSSSSSESDKGIFVAYCGSNRDPVLKNVHNSQIQSLGNQGWTRQCWMG